MYVIIFYLIRRLIIRFIFICFQLYLYLYFILREQCKLFIFLNKKYILLNFNRFVNLEVLIRNTDSKVV